MRYAEVRIMNNPQILRYQLQPLLSRCDLYHHYHGAGRFPLDLSPAPSGDRKVVRGSSAEANIATALENLGRLDCASKTPFQLPVANMLDLLTSALDLEGFPSGVPLESGTGTEVLRVPLEDETSILISNHVGSHIDYPVDEHQGLLANRYPKNDLTRWRTIYNSDCECTHLGEDLETVVDMDKVVADVQAAVAAIVSEAGRTLELDDER